MSSTQLCLVERSGDPNLGDPAKANLVAHNLAPNSLALVNPSKSGGKGATELASQIDTADKLTRSCAGAKLSVIVEQVRFLQQDLKIPGKVYYIYKQNTDKDKEFLSMISPKEWGADGPELVAGYRLEYDMSWTRLTDLKNKTQSRRRSLTRSWSS